MKKLYPIDVFFWTFRRNEKDVVHLYDALSDVMRLATGGDMLNFGYWDKKTSCPLEAQKNLCQIFGKMAGLASKRKVIDVGSGFGDPAILWQKEYPHLEISSININYNQLKDSAQHQKTMTDDYHERDPPLINFLNSTATVLPFGNETHDCVLSLEAAQHFKPLKNFFSESFRVLKKNGRFALALPVMEKMTKANFIKLGILSMTWSSEHYTCRYVKSLLEKEGFNIIETRNIGSSVYEPLTLYYLKNRESLKKKFLENYPSYVEKILFRSLVKMRSVSRNKIIDYLLILCQK